MLTHPLLFEQLVKFRDGWNANVPEFLKIDGSLPGFGPADRLFHCLPRGRALTPSERGVSRGVVLVASELIARCWSDIGIQPIVRLVNDLVVLEGEVQGGKIALALEEEFHRLREAPPKSFELTKGFRRHLLTPEGWLTPFVISCALGLSPTIRGVWEEGNVDEEKLRTQRLLASLARTVVGHYERLYPDEPIGQIGELYLSAGVYPLLGMQEGFPVVSAVEDLFRFFNEYRVGQGKVLRFAENISRFADEHLSSIGLVVSAALSEDAAVRRAVAERKGGFCGLLRPAYLTARERVGKQGDWMQSPESGSFYAQEKTMGFLPWFAMKPLAVEKLRKERYFLELCGALSLFDFHTAVDLCDRMIADDPKILDIRLQRISLDLLARQYDEAELKMRSLLTEPGAEEDGRLWRMFGVICFAKGEISEAVRHYKQALNVTLSGDDGRIALLNDLSSALIRAEQFREALEVCQQVRREDPSDIASLLNEAFVQRLLGDPVRSRELLRMALDQEPYDMRVFQANFA